MDEAALAAIVEDILTDPDFGGESWHDIAVRIVSAVCREIDGNFREASNG